MGVSVTLLLLHLLLFQSICWIPNICAAADTISRGRSLSGNQTMVSKGGSFELGFFKPGNSSDFYIGIWFAKVSKQTVVWVANREAPVSNPATSELKISDDGNLILLGGLENLVWSSNSTVKSPNSSVAVLQNDGNLILMGGMGPSDIIWQSFDHPTHAWLPGAWVGRNKITGEVQKLTSWKNSEDPAPGPFSLSIDPNGSTSYFLYWNGSETYWTSGNWNEYRFDKVPEMTSAYNYNFTFINNSVRTSFFYTIYKTKDVISYSLLDLSGQFTQWTWNIDSWMLFWSQPRAQCEVYALCGPFGVCNEKGLPYCRCMNGFQPVSPREYWNLSDWSAGCSRRTPLKCDRNASKGEEQDKFMVVPNMRLPVSPVPIKVESAGECEVACLRNCSCTAYAYDGSCSTWNGRLLNLQELLDGDSNPRTLHVRVAASELPESQHDKRPVVVVIAVAIAVAVVVLAVILGLWWKRRPVKLLEGALVRFRYDSLQSATKNFSRTLGAGGFGSVFKGVLRDKTVVAVKKLDGLQQGEKQFRTEVSTLGAIQHINLVRLRGFCTEGAKRLLVYDYMPNRSLGTHIFDDKSRKLGWRTRYNIILGVSRGLAYLHEKCRECIVHCDIKPENILLDAEFCPKIADFGMAKLIGRDFSRVLTTMRGTRGYLAPEWISGLPITSKVDVYSFGMMVFEVLSRRRNAEHSEGCVGFYPLWAAGRVAEDELLSLVDRDIEGDVDLNELRRACRIACWCIQDSEADRPSMGIVVQILEGVLEMGIPPIPRSLHHLVGEERNIVFFSKTSSSSEESI